MIINKSLFSLLVTFYVLSSSYSPGCFKTIGTITQNKYFIQYSEYIQCEAGHSCFSSAGFGKTLSLLNHRASLVWLAMIARSMKGPGGEEEEERKGRAVSSLRACFNVVKRRWDNVKVSLTHTASASLSLQSFISLTDLLLTNLWIVVSASLSLLPHTFCIQVFIYQHTVVLFSWIIPKSPLAFLCVSPTRCIPALFSQL